MNANTGDFMTDDVKKQAFRVGYRYAIGTASFYDWIVRTLDPDFMKKIHRVFRIRGSVELFFVEEYGKSCQELWDEYVASLTKETR